MSNAISGGVTLSVSFTQQLDAGAGRLNAYSVPVQPSQSAQYTPGTAANQANKLAQGNPSAAATPYDLDLSSVACVDGSTGLAHVRELAILNLDPVNILTVGDDGTVSN